MTACVRGHILLLCLLVAGMCARSSASWAPFVDPWQAEVSKSAGNDAASVTVEAEKATITVAERLRVRVNVAASPDVSVLMPPSSESLGQFQVISHSDAPPRLMRSGKTLHAREYVLEPFLDGTYTIPPIEVPYRREFTVPQRNGNGSPSDSMASGLLRTEPINISVISILPEADKQPHEDPVGALGQVRTIVEPPPDRGRTGLWVSLITGTLLAGVGFYIFRTRSGRRKETNECIRALEKLRVMSEATSLAIADEVALILRRCLAERCDPAAIGMTTDELLSAALRWRHLDSHESEALRECLLTCDAVRYAGEAPDPQRMRATVVNAEKIVRWLGRAPIVRPDAVSKPTRGAAAP